MIHGVSIKAAFWYPLGALAAAFGLYAIFIALLAIPALVYR